MCTVYPMGVITAFPAIIHAGWMDEQGVLAQNKTMPAV